jgi:hypothetical protein
MERNADAAAAGLFLVIMVMTAVIGLVCAIIIIAGMWKIFTKAGKPGWASLIPIYNLIVLLEVIERPLWWIVLCFIPFVNMVVIVLMYLELAKKFGKDILFAIGLVLLPIVFIPILGFGSAQYRPTKYYY